MNPQLAIRDLLQCTFALLESQFVQSGPLPSNQRVTWRGDSDIEDGNAQGIDLVGGYYDAGDNVKFQFPMAYTITTLAWGVVEYRSQLDQLGQLQYALDAVKWGPITSLKPIRSRMSYGQTLEMVRPITRVG
ncbi:hypothetical protein R1sor_017408 [Riccia sorocarpa]|uniref:cellulase n=1 Tax=Riccia sorocarpa TaxID=122646 RepID=A0ABD3IAS2_9MARC